MVSDQVETEKYDEKMKKYDVLVDIQDKLSDTDAVSGATG